jgi:hypothetical protein
MDGAWLLTLYEGGLSAAPRARAALLAGAALGQSAEGLTLGDVDRAIWSLRQALVGEGGEATTNCPVCGARMEFALPPGFAPPPAVASVAQVHWQGQSHDLRLPLLSDLGRAGFGPAHLNPDAPWSDPGFAAAAEAALEAADPALRLQIALLCPDCATETLQDFDPAAYVWAELAEMARRLVREVADLARHYHWSEADITAMSPLRRALYLAEASR